MEKALMKRQVVNQLVVGEVNESVRGKKGSGKENNVQGIKAKSTSPLLLVVAVVQGPGPSAEG